MKMFKHSIVFVLFLLPFAVSHAQVAELENVYLNGLAESFMGKEFSHKLDNYFWSKCLGKQQTLTNAELNTEVKALMKNAGGKKEFYQRINYYLSSELSYYYDVLRVSKTVMDKKKGLDKDGYEDYLGANKITLSVLGTAGNEKLYKYIHQQGEHAALSFLCAPTTVPINIPGQGSKDNNEPKVFQFVEQVPVFPGGETELMKTISHNIVYPKMERDNDIQGKVMLRFIVCTDGHVSNVEIVRSVSPRLDAEARRVVKLLPDFKPGTQQGKPVLVYYNLPLIFKLQ